MKYTKNIDLFNGNAFMVEYIFRQQTGSFFISRLFLAQQLDQGWRG